MDNIGGLWMLGYVSTVESGGIVPVFLGCRAIRSPEDSAEVGRVHETPAGGYHAYWTVGQQWIS